MINLSELIRHRDQLTTDILPELKNMIETYPYFQAPRMLYLYLLHKTSDDRYEAELHHASIYITDRRGLYALMNDERSTRFQEPLEVPSIPQPDASKGNEQGTKHNDGRSFSLIDSFLSEYSDKSTETQAESLVQHPTKKEIVSDYTSYLLDTKDEEEQPSEEIRKESETTPDISITARPIPKKTRETLEDEQAVPESSEGISDKYFTETLAKIYVKQGKYSKALEIIQRLYLRDPNKNIYFADQIRYLEKLLINSRNQKNK